MNVYIYIHTCQSSIFRIYIYIYTYTFFVGYTHRELFISWRIRSQGSTQFYQLALLVMCELAGGQNLLGVFQVSFKCSNLYWIFHLCSSLLWRCARNWCPAAFLGLWPSHVSSPHLSYAPSVVRRGRWSPSLGPADLAETDHGFHAASGLISSAASAAVHFCATAAPVTLIFFNHSIWTHQLSQVLHRRLEDTFLIFTGFPYAIPLKVHDLLDLLVLGDQSAKLCCLFEDFPLLPPFPQSKALLYLILFIANLRYHAKKIVAG